MSGIDQELVLPDKEKIAEIMLKIGLGHMDEKTQLATELGGKKLAVFGVNLSWELALASYVATLPRVVHITTSMLKPIFMRDVFAAAGKPELFVAGVAEKLWKEK